MGSLFKKLNKKYSHYYAHAHSHTQAKPTKTWKGHRNEAQYILISIYAFVFFHRFSAEPDTEKLRG